MATNISATDARKQFAELLQSTQKGERFAILRHGKVLGVLVSPEDLAKLEGSTLTITDTDAVAPTPHDGTGAPVTE